ncbi:hypothetical protein CHS0354_006967 [Potamilus streckersoni]|uniref:Coiled-coil domain-containing protein 130 n=1 Tax=Potamilus streckersoni TaxID=2493646 RepID=A0AAE0RWH5_9BIVA|nr:hypothetical protein CHS0354_006967 [Potamilus streckersoni]
MAERKAVNKYYPPDWDPSKGSINEYVGQHPLRDRARKLHMGILVIRFEMPYNIWCDGCNSHIGMGVRYNAEKKKVGNYFSTPIYQFRMKCHLCDNYFEIKTDPKNHDYVIVSGARRKEQRWDPKENEQIVPEDKATQKKLANDAMFKLEHGTDDQQKGKAVIMGLGQIAYRRSEWKDDYLLNKLARNKFRSEKKAAQTAREADMRLLEKSSLDIPLLQEKEEDIRLAGLIKYSTVQSYDEKQIEKRKEIEKRPFFTLKAKTSTAKFPKCGLDLIKSKLSVPAVGSLAFDTQLSVSKSLTQDKLGIKRKLPKVKKVQRAESVKSDSSDKNILETDTAKNNLKKHETVTTEINISKDNKKNYGYQYVHLLAPICANSAGTVNRTITESSYASDKKVIPNGSDSNQMDQFTDCTSAISCDGLHETDADDNLSHVTGQGALSLVSIYADSDSQE